MKYVTRSNVYHNGLDDSTHRIELSYNDGENLTYVFSSELYLNIFKKKLEENREFISSSLSKRFRFDISNDKLSDIRLYMTTEKRGFLIIGEHLYSCLDTIKLDGAMLTKRN